MGRTDVIGRSHLLAPAVAAFLLAAALIQGPAAASGKKTRSGPISCSGVRHMRLVDISIAADGDGIRVTGTCHVILERSQVRAGGAGIRVSGAAVVEVIDSVVTGADAAVAINGAAVVRARSSRFVGGRKVSGAGTFVDGGRNSWD